jgi:predicted RNA-binding Zn-ribbon protein involved in translation (DUF1610 family)
MRFKEFYVCSKCGGAVCGDKREFFVCPNCGRALCGREEIGGFTDNYCGNCGYELTSAKKESLALVDGKD